MHSVNKLTVQVHLPGQSLIQHSSHSNMNPTVAVSWKTTSISRTEESGTYRSCNFSNPALHICTLFSYWWGNITTLIFAVLCVHTRRAEVPTDHCRLPRCKQYGRSNNQDEERETRHLMQISQSAWQLSPGSVGCQHLANQAPSLPQVAPQGWDRHVRAEPSCSNLWKNLANVNRRVSAAA